MARHEAATSKPDTTTVASIENPEQAEDFDSTGGGWAGAQGGSSTPTDILVIGTDITDITGWRAAVPADDGEPLPVLYKQGGRVYASGVLFRDNAVVGAGNPAAIVVPAGHAPSLVLQDESVSDYFFTLAHGINDLAVAECYWSSGDFIVGNIRARSGTSFTDGDQLCLDGISWPAAS